MLALFRQDSVDAIPIQTEYPSVNYFDGTNQKGRTPLEIARLREKPEIYDQPTAVESRKLLGQNWYIRIKLLLFEKVPSSVSV